MGMEQARLDNPEYFESFLPIVSKMYAIESKKDIKLDFNNFIEQENYLYSQLDENSSDECYELLLGTKTNQFNKTESCSTNINCLKYYTVNSIKNNDCKEKKLKKY